MFTAIARELGRAGEMMPMVVAERFALAERLSPGSTADACTLKIKDVLRSRAVAPEKIHSPEPLFPANELRARAVRMITIEGTVAEDGFFFANQIVGGDPALPGFIDAAVAATSRWRFRPPTMDRCPFAAILTVNVSFTR